MPQDKQIAGHLGASRQDPEVRNHITVSSAVAIVASPTFLETLSTGLNNITTALLPRSALARAHQAFEHVLDYNRPAGAFGKPLVATDDAHGAITAITDWLAGRSSLENTTLLLSLCTFLVLAMSWTSRLGNLGRFSPFTRSPQQAGSTKVRDEDFSYITAEDLQRHGADGATARHKTSNESLGPPRDTDMLVLKNKRKEYTVHFPAYSIGKGELTVGTVRHAAAKKAGVSDARRIKILYRGKNLKDDLRTCKAEGLRDGSELLLTIADVSSSASGSEDDDDDDDELADGAGQDGDGEGGRRRRNRGKKSKKKAKREASYQQNSEHLGVPPASSSQPSTRPQSPKPPTPATPIDKIRALRGTLESFLPQVQDFQRSPPEDQGKKEYEHKRLSETVLTQVLLKLDGVDTEGDQEARAKRKELVKDTQAVLHDIDAVMK
ncbi:hypothetical protein KC357_g8721 [Hortaea werneckii]|nr:hypothetical protein KC357_g8721 [Hortaea werneckii]